MSNIYEALEQAQRERHGLDNKKSVADPKNKLVEISHLRCNDRGRPVVQQDVDVSSLYRNIDILLPERPKRTIQFISAQEGEGVSTIVKEMARTAVDHLGKKVLILDAAHHNPTQHKLHNVRCDKGWHVIARNGGDANEACLRTGNPNLFVSPLARSTPSDPFFVDIQASAIFLNEVKKGFDLVLIDSAPAELAPDSIALSRYTDGVVVVLEAEQTKWEAAENLRDMIQNNGGTILGVVFNKRRNHIPKSIYRWLN